MVLSFIPPVWGRATLFHLCLPPPSPGQFRDQFTLHFWGEWRLVVGSFVTACPRHCLKDS
jgi:hypothetical protein